MAMLINFRRRRRGEHERSRCVAGGQDIGLIGVVQDGLEAQLLCSWVGLEAQPTLLVRRAGFRVPTSRWRVRPSPDWDRPDSHWLDRRSDRTEG